MDLRRLSHLRDFFVHLLEIPEQDIQTVSWQDIVARIMSLRDTHAETAINLGPQSRRFLGSQSKKRLDAHDIANRLMRKENYFIALINKDVLNFTLRLPFVGNRTFFSRTLEWYLNFVIIDFVFDHSGQVNQDCLKARQRGHLSATLRRRFAFAGVINLILAPFSLAYILVLYFFNSFLVSRKRRNGVLRHTNYINRNLRAILLELELGDTRLWPNGSFASSTSFPICSTNVSTCHIHLRPGIWISSQSK